MKFGVPLKVTDILEEAIQDAAASMATPTAEGNEDVYCQQQKAMMDISILCKKWFGTDGFLTVEIDTEAQTCTVMAAVESDQAADAGSRPAEGSK